MKRESPFLCRLSALLILHLSLFISPAGAQQRFHRELPPGNYSGICPIGDNRYALVSDKSADDGFFILRIDIDSVRRRITSLTNEGFRSSGQPNRDMEAVCYRHSSRTLYIAGERDNEVLEYTLDGQLTGRRLAVPATLRAASHNFGIEALCYDSLCHRFFLTTERPVSGDSLLRIQTFGDDLQPAECYIYQPDAPQSRKHFHGVAELCALSDRRLLVLERQIRVPRLKLGAKTIVRIYEVTLPSAPTPQLPISPTPQLLTKRLLLEFATRLSLTSRKFANYEGLCQPRPGLLLLVADSQNRYKGILRDWFRVVSIDEK